MGLIVWIGPTSFAELGVHGWWTPLIPAALVILFTYWLSRAEEKAEKAETDRPRPRDRSGH
jgi:CHASE2 domain-containing sensor protein